MQTPSRLWLCPTPGLVAPPPPLMRETGTMWHFGVSTTLHIFDPKWVMLGILAAFGTINMGREFEDVNSPTHLLLAFAPSQSGRDTVVHAFMHRIC